MNYAIIAAGEGSRLAQEGVAKPKPLVDICGEPMIGRLINLFCRCNAESISIIVNEQMTEVREYIESLSLDIPVNLVVKKKINPMIGACGISAFPMSGRVVAKMALAEDPTNFIIMHAIGVNVAGQICSVVAGGVVLALVK